MFNTKNCSVKIIMRFGYKIGVDIITQIISGFKKRGGASVTDKMTVIITTVLCSFVRFQHIKLLAEYEPSCKADTWQSFL